MVGDTTLESLFQRPQVRIPLVNQIYDVLDRLRERLKRCEALS